MAKSIFTKKYGLFLDCLRSARKKAGLTQEQVAERLQQTQSFVSKCERGERRIDVVELQAFCLAIEIPLCEFVKKLEKTVEQSEEQGHE